MKAKETPDLLAAFQSISPFHVETAAVFEHRHAVLAPAGDPHGAGRRIDLPPVAPCVGGDHDVDHGAAEDHLVLIGQLESHPGPVQLDVVHGVIGAGVGAERPGAPHGSQWLLAAGRFAWP